MKAEDQDKYKAEVYKLCEEVVASLVKITQERNAGESAITATSFISMLNEKLISAIVYGSVGEALMGKYFGESFKVQPLDMSGSPLNISTIHMIATQLCVIGEVHVVNCGIVGAGHALYLLQLMRKNLSEEDLEAIRRIVGSEIVKRENRP
jgi:hypothetical protein